MYDRRRVLKIIENIYLIVLDLEQMRRQGPPRAKPNQEEEHEDELAKWNETYAEKVKKLWESLRLDDHAEGRYDIDKREDGSLDKSNLWFFLVHLWSFPSCL